MSDFVCGANDEDFHYTGVNWGRDLAEPDLVADIRNVVAGDPSPDGKGVLAIQRGIEVGHVFLLGSYYSQSMNATFLDEKGKPQLLQMGCYGIGVTRIVGAAIEQNHDARGMIWPEAIAPFAVVVCPIGYDRSPAVREAADALHAALDGAGIDVMLDDRGERPGAMFADWELIGVPHRVVLSDRGLKAGELEYQGRRDAAATNVAADRRACLPEGQARRMTGELSRHGRGRRRVVAATVFGPLVAGWPRLAWPARRPRSRSPTRCARRSPPRSPIRRRRSRSFDEHRRAPGLPALARRDERSPAQAEDRARDAGRVPADALVREQARRASSRRCCSAWSRSRAAFASTRSRSPARAATPR